MPVNILNLPGLTVLDFKLTDEEQGTLDKVLLDSRRQILLPLGADEREYRLLHSLETQLEN